MSLKIKNVNFDALVAGLLTAEYRPLVRPMRAPRRRWRL